MSDSWEPCPRRPDRRRSGGPTIDTIDTPDTYFHAEVRTRGAIPTVVASGELDAASSKELERILAEASGPASARALDLEAVTFIDSSGLRVVTAAVRDAEAHGGTFRVCAASEPVRRIFEITGLGSLLPAAG